MSARSLGAIEKPPRSPTTASARDFAPRVDVRAAVPIWFTAASSTGSTTAAAASVAASAKQERTAVGVHDASGHVFVQKRDCVSGRGRW
jgi:hypothetical protein